MLTISISEYKEKWSVADKGEDVYTNGSLRGTIIYEDNNNLVIKILQKG